MKAEDLMIGDYCRVWREGLCIKNKGTIVKVLEIDAENRLSENGLLGSAHCRPLDGQFDGGIWCEYLDPIPLTAEILEKNGFVYNDLPFVQGWEQFGLTLNHGGDGFRITCGQNVALVIDSVHELQHALRLCGINKEIEL